MLEAAGAEPSTETSFESAVLKTWPGARPLTDKELSARFPKRNFGSGWALPAAQIGLPEPMVLALDREFPWSLPRIGLLEQPPLCAFPHVEEDGVFCLTPATAAAALPIEIGHAQQLVGEATDAYQKGASGVNRIDFLREFGTYWQLGQGNSDRVELWLGDLNTTQNVAIVADGSRMYVSESREKLEKWLENRGIEVEEVQPGLYVRLGESLYPKDYPATSAELVALVATAGADARQLLAASVKMKRRLVVLFGFEHDGQVIIGASFIEVKNEFPDPRQHGQQLIAAPGKRSVSADHVLNRFTAARFPAQRCDVTRADSDYLNVRTTGHVPQQIRSFRIGMIGCGALGGTVALQLAQSGVRRMTLIDSDVLNIENVGRHELNASYIGQHKAKALRSEIMGRFCDYDIQAVPKSWQVAFSDDPATLDDCDLLICATGDWLSDAHLNSVSSELNEPVLFCWVERFALAGHGVLVLPAGACLQCVKREFGEFDYQVSRIGGDLPTDPSCGAYYQPFSAYTSNQVAAMITKLALDAIEGRVERSHLRTWVASYDEFDRVGADIDATWHKPLVVEGGFERVFRRDLVAKESCPKYPHG